jgi:hypothetical protein
MAIHRLEFKLPPRDLEKEPLPPCMRCDKATATRGVESAERRFSVVVCERCAIAATFEIARAGARDVKPFSIGAPGVDVALPLPVIPAEIGGIDLSQLARELLDGAAGAHDMASVEFVRGLVEIEIAFVESRVARELTTVEAAGVDVFATQEFYARKRRLREALRDTQERLHSPRSLFR